ncbi:MAG: ribosome small subunit-dependent GTPase A [Desulfuromusa sp.]|jgi:ribosome biogenesis GTPase|nr:ribosome small subunit-dependent GTPase A [Desulfuromusa sp.]
MKINSLELNVLGWNPWFNDQGRECCQPEQQMARVTAVDRGWYTVRNEAGEVTAQVTGKFLHTTKAASEMPCVGDWVCVHYDAKDAASIHGVLPRKSFLRRKTAGKDTQLQMIAANIDVAFIVQSCQYDFNVPRMERYLMMVSEGQVEPVLVLSKMDLVDDDALAKYITEIRAAGINARIIALSNVTGAGLEEIREPMISGKTYCLLGSSGVGKSTLINRLTGQDILKTGRVSASGEGRHTTVRRQLIVLEQGGMIIDTPGMREVGIIAAKEGSEDIFNDIEELAGSCRFGNCSHGNEPGCAVLQAIQAGTLPSARYENYLKLKQEAKSHARPWRKRS